MVKNKNAGGRLHRSSTCKKKDSSHPGSGKDLTPAGDPGDGDVPAAPPERLTAAGQDQLGFPDRVYLLASVIFQNNHLEKPAAHRLVNYGKERGLPLPGVKDEMLCTAYELAFNTLKYQELLEGIMIDSCFYLTQPMSEDQMSLVAVMLYDFQDRKFLPRECHGEEERIQEVRDVENYLLRFKTKLAASLARCRIKHDLLSIECILPESVKTKQERSSCLPLYTWVNTLKSSLDEVQSTLKSLGISQVKSIEQLEGQTFCLDPHCGDMLVFPAQLKAELQSTKLLSDHKLIIQDKSCSLGPNSVRSVLPDDGDVLMVGCFSGLTVSHTASLIAGKHEAGGRRPIVFICVSGHTDAQREELQEVVALMGCKNVKLIPEDFQSLDSGDKQLENVRVILLTPKCSVSAISNPVELILQENRDTDLLQDLSQDSVPQSRLEALVAQQRKDIDHALKFPKVLAVVYSTCSTYPEENEEVVSRALERANASLEQKVEPAKANFRLSPSPFSSPNHAEGPKESDSFFMLKPSEHSNGCFLAVLMREPEPVVTVAPREVLARANAKGILDGIGGSNQPTRKEQHGQTNRLTKATHVHTSQQHLSLSILSKNQESRSSSNAASCGRQEFANKRQGRDKTKNSMPSPFSPSKQESTSSSSSSCPSPSSSASSKQENGNFSSSSSSKQENSNFSSSSKQENSNFSSPSSSKQDKNNSSFSPSSNPEKNSSSISPTSKQDNTSSFFSSSSSSPTSKQDNTSSFFSSSSSSKQEDISSSSSSSSKQEDTTPMKTERLHLAPPPTPVVPAAPPAVRSRRGHQEVLKPVVLVLPTVNFPNFFSPQHSRTGFNPSLWRPTTQSGPVPRSKETTVKSRPLV